jgi:hypothetical protein
MPAMRRARQLLILLAVAALLATAAGPAGGAAAALGTAAPSLARLRKLGPGHYRGVLPGARLHAGSWVSLRAWARDAGDSRVHQTLIRAFPVR